MKIAFPVLATLAFVLSGAGWSSAASVYSLQDEPATTADPQGEGEESPSDAVPPPPVPEPMDLDKAEKGVKGDGCGSKTTCASGKCGLSGCACCTGKPWTLPQPCALQKMGIKVGGWVQQGITFNSKSPADGFNGPVATNDLDSRYQMNQLWLFLERPVDTGGCGWDIGGRIDMLYGTDHRFGENNGLEERINGDNYQGYGMVIPQIYAEIAYNDLTVKLGHFATLLDFEMIPAPGNPFYSHSYSYGYTVPQLVTGLLAEWQMTDQFSIHAGTHRGWMQWEDDNSSWDIMAGFKWASCDKATSLVYAISTGPQTFEPALPVKDQNRFVHSLVLQQKLTDRLKYVLVQNLGIENFEQPFGTPDRPIGQAEWYGINQYLLYEINKCWAANLRVEWMRDDDGVRIAGPGNIPGTDAWDGAGYAGNFYGITAGLNWRPRPNWVIRPEVRYDKYAGETSWIPGKQALPFDAGNSDNQTTFAVDAIFLY